MMFSIYMSQEKKAVRSRIMAIVDLSIKFYDIVSSFQENHDMKEYSK